MPQAKNLTNTKPALPTLTPKGSAVERAYAAAAQGFDAAIWLAQCDAIGLDVSEWDGGLLFMYGDSDPIERCFLECWVNLSPDGDKAVLKLLKSRATPQPA